MEEVGRGPDLGDGHPRTDRPRSRLVLQPPLLRRRQPLARRGAPRRDLTRAAGPWEAWDQQPSSHPTQSSWVEAPLPQQDEDSFQLGRVVCGGGRDGSDREGAHGHCGLDCSGLIPASVGAPVAHRLEPCATVPRVGRQLVSFCASLFAGREIEGGRVGRGHHAELPPDRFL